MTPVEAGPAVLTVIGAVSGVAVLVGWVRAVRQNRQQAYLSVHRRRLIRWVTAGVLVLLLIALRLAGVLHWSWWWILSPLWLPALALAPLAFVAVLLATLMSVAGGLEHVRRRRAGERPSRR